jgi:hypothetical protein
MAHGVHDRSSQLRPPRSESGQKLTVQFLVFLCFVLPESNTTPTSNPTAGRNLPPYSLQSLIPHVMVVALL